MRATSCILSLVVLCPVSFGAPASSPVPVPLARCHFAGTNQALANPDAKFPSIAALPQTQALLNQTLQRLAQSARLLLADALPAAADARAAALIRPLLDDLVREESFVEVRGADLQRLEWLLAVNLKPARLVVWRTNLVELAKLMESSAAPATPVEGWSSTEVRCPNSTKVVRWVEAGSWLVLGAGEAQLPGLLQAVRDAKSSGRPVAALAGTWLEWEGDLSRLAGPLRLRAEIPWPHVQGSVSYVGNRLRTAARLRWPEEITGPVEPWRVPLNLVTEPLISFSVARGIQPFASRFAFFRRLGLDPVPNQLCLWAQSTAPVQLCMAAPVENAPEHIRLISERFRDVAGPEWEKKGLCETRFNPTNALLHWEGLPMMAPFLQPVRDARTEYIVGGLYQTAPSTNAFPKDLLAQFKEREDLLIYDWEVTQPRLAQWRLMAQLFAIVLREGQISGSSAGLPWLTAIEGLLGNTATEVTSVSSREWKVVRNSDVGLSAVELIGLIRWLESVDFPRPGLALPQPTPRPAKKPAAAPKPASGQKSTSGPPANRR